MSAFEICRVVVPSRSRGEDRLAVVRRDDGVVIVVADGAGGTTFGAEAAEYVVGQVEALADEIFRSESTAVIVVVDRQGVRGASVGDSAAVLQVAEKVSSAFVDGDGEGRFSSAEGKLQRLRRSLRGEERA